MYLLALFLNKNPISSSRRGDHNKNPKNGHETEISKGEGRRMSSERENRENAYASE